jgi:hypothetical protein
MMALISTNVILLVFAFFLLKKSTRVDSALLKHFALLELAWAGFQFLLWLFILFDILEARQPDQTFFRSAGKETIVLLSALAGFVICHLALMLNLVFRLFGRQSHFRMQG